ncbi:unnamed protein product [Knipowitschia caucasica]
MASCLSEELACSICLSLFTEPVVLLCGHSFCRECISKFLFNQPQCPTCRGPAQAQDLRSSHVLKTLVEKAKETTKQKLEYRLDKERAEFLCLEHDEKLKLFCITDQQLICVICRDSHKHDRHQFKPVSEASALVKTELQNLISKISTDTEALHTLVSRQEQLISKTKERSAELQTLVSSEFKKMYAFLRKKEKDLQDKVKNDEEEALQKMNQNLNNIQEAKAENKKITDTLTQILKMTDTEPLLKMWSEDGEAKAAKASFQPKNNKFRVEEPELHLGPYESHLQMFVWKEMIQVVKRRE